MEAKPVLDAARIRTVLGETDVKLLLFDTIDSTNNEAKRRIARGAGKPMLLCADTQRAGRGRMGRSFYSPADTGAYMSLALPWRRPLADALSLTAAAAVAAALAVEDCGGPRVGIKWVNDLYHGGKKVGGILTEAAGGFVDGAPAFVVIGIGMNLHTCDFPAELQGRAGSLGAAGLSREDWIGRCVKRLLDIVQGMPGRGYMESYRERSIVLGREVVYVENGTAHHAFACAVGDDGALCVRHADGTERTLNTGEISLRTGAECGAF